MCVYVYMHQDVKKAVIYSVGVVVVCTPALLLFIYMVSYWKNRLTTSIGCCRQREFDEPNGRTEAAADLGRAQSL